jgi:PadR family transcriptional regulator, regulatory protein PadR
LPDANDVQLKRGVLELCVLALLTDGDSYAYEIASRLAAEIDMGEGTIYPLMRRLQADGLLADYLGDSPAGPPRRYYRLTDGGRARLQQQVASWSAFANSIDRIAGLSR